MSQLQDVVSGYSRGLYSSWFFYKPDRLLFDAGEGIIDRLSKRVYAIQRILLTHGHEDHISGIPAFVNLRNLGAGAREKALTIFHPKNDTWVQLLREYVTKKQERFLRYELAWEALEPGDRIDLGQPNRPRYIEAFACRHRPRAVTLGYRIMEQRTALEPELAALSQAEISALIRERGKDQVCRTYMHNIFTYTGDTTGIDPAVAADADVLMHEATYFEDDCPEKCFHCTFEKALAIAQEARVKTLALFHASGGFAEPVLRRRLAELIRSRGVEFPVYLFWRHRTFGYNEPASGDGREKTGKRGKPPLPDQAC